MGSFVGDVRYALRQMMRSPGFAVVTVLTLALGVGANTAIFSVIQAVLLHPAGVDDPARVVSFHSGYTQLNLPSIGVSVPDFHDVESLRGIVEAGALTQPGSFNAALPKGNDGERTEHLEAGRVTWRWFQVFGARPILGRTFAPEEDQKVAGQVAVLSYGAWQRMFGGQSDAIGQSVLLDGTAYRVIGVMRSDFDWPRKADLWVPLALGPEADGHRFDEEYDSVVRLAPGIPVARLNAALEQKRMEEIRREGTGSYGKSSGWGMFARALTEDAAGDLRKPFYALFAVAGMILLIACANISGLMLARAAGRTRELAIRTALGASVGQITAQFVVETALLAGVATMIGVAAGPVLGRLLLLAIPHDLAKGFEVLPDGRLVLVAAGFGLLATVLAGLAPAVQVARMQRRLRLSEQQRGGTVGVGRQRLRGWLVGTEVALAFLLVAGTGLFVSSLKSLQGVDPGFRSAGVLTGNVALGGAKYKGVEGAPANFVREVTDRLSQGPGVVAAGAVYPLPFGEGGEVSGSFEIEERVQGADEPGPHSDRRWATAGFLSALQIPLMRGRWFADRDRAGAPQVVVVDDVLARAYWPGQDPVGQRVRIGSRSPWMTVVGMVGHVRRDSLEVDENKGVMYLALAQSPLDRAAFVVRTKADPEAMRGALVEAVRQVDASQAVYGVTTLSSLVGESLGARQLLVWLLTLFGGLALVLAGIGIYGLMSFTAAERTTEIGIRMALGAQRWQVVAIVLGETVRLVGLGIVVGVGLTMVAQRVLAHSFAGIGGGVWESVGLAAVCLAGAAFFAAAIPARRSAGVEPVVALRSE